MFRKRYGDRLLRVGLALVLALALLPFQERTALAQDPPPTVTCAWTGVPGFSDVKCTITDPGGIASWRLRRINPSNGRPQGIEQKQRHDVCVTMDMFTITAGHWQSHDHQLSVEEWADKAKGPVSRYVISAGFTGTITVTPIQIRDH